MRHRFPICPCQSGLTEFAWDLVCTGGPMLSRHDIYRCDDCGQALYHLPAYGIVFMPIDKAGASEAALLSMLKLERHFGQVRDEAGHNLVSIKYEGLPRDTRFYTRGADGSWMSVDDAMMIEVPRRVAPIRIDEGGVYFFLHPPQLCRMSNL